MPLTYPPRRRRPIHTPSLPSLLLLLPPFHPPPSSPVPVSQDLIARTPGNPKAGKIVKPTADVLTVEPLPYEFLV